MVILKFFFFLYVLILVSSVAWFFPTSCDVEECTSVSLQRQMLKKREREREKRKNIQDSALHFEQLNTEMSVKNAFKRKFFN